MRGKIPDKGDILTASFPTGLQLHFIIYNVIDRGDSWTMGIISDPENDENFNSKNDLKLGALKHIENGLWSAEICE